jgi:hypothetical protein
MGQNSYQTSQQPLTEEQRELFLQEQHRDLVRSIKGIFSEEELRLMASLPHVEVWRVLVKYLSRLSSALDEQIWDSRSWEQVLMLKGQKRTLTIMLGVPKEMSEVLKAMKEPGDV